MSLPALQTPEARRRLLEQLLRKKAAGAARHPLSFAQQRLWFLEQLGGLGSAYHIRKRMRLQGALNREALRRALDRIVERHEALRTTFRAVDGEPEQRIAPAEESGFVLLEHDLSGPAEAEAGLRRLMAEEARAPFDLERGPLVRGRLIRLGAEDHVLLLTMHHIVTDGWSMAVFIRELTTLYGVYRRGEADPLPALSLQYADYAAWQRRWVDGEVLRQQAEYWKRTLSGAPGLLELPTDRPRPLRQDHAGSSVRLVLDEETAAGLKALSQRHGTTLFMTLLAGLAAVLSRLSGQEDVVVGTPTANRGRREIEGLIGFFVNTLALRVDLSGSPTSAELLERVMERVLEAQQHQDIPFEQVVDLVQPTRSLAHSPVFQVMFAWQNTPRGTLELPGLRVGPVGSPPGGTSKFDLELKLSEAGGRISGTLEYATSLFEKASAERFVSYLRRVLAGMAADDGRPVARLEMLSPAERAQVVEAWNATEAEYPADLCVQELFEAQAGRTPDAVALVHAHGALTYAELNARGNRLAHHLVELGVGPDVPVALCVERSPEMVVGLLAVLKAGGAYVPLDPEYPEDRLRGMLEDTAPAVLLTQGRFAGRLRGLGVPVVALDGDDSSRERRPGTKPERPDLTPDHLAYVMYTSGSTGRPKGVMLGHRSVVNRLAWMQEAYGLRARDAMLQKSTYGFDVSVWEFFWPLAVGARVVLAHPEGHRDPGYLVETIRSAGITVLHFVPSMLPVFLEHPDAETCTGLKQVFCSGEALQPSLVRRFRERFPGVELHNFYGPTEAGEVSAWSCEAGAVPEAVPIGAPIPNTRLYVLDGNREPVPVGVAGEVYVGGVAVGRGYRNRAELTAERFVPDPFGGEAGARLYRTGDLGRWLPEGTIEFLGRIDGQVKVRGFRVEPGEVEARLGEHAGVREAVVLAREDAPGDRRLVAYCVCAEPVEVEALRAHLLARLPEYMVPAAYVRLERLPLTPSGKLDRRALPAPEGDAYARRGYVAPASPVELQLVTLWEEVLGARPIGTTDNFFDLGGNSLLAVRVAARARERFGCEIPLSLLITGGTVAHLAELVAGRAVPGPRRAVVPIQPGGSRPPVFLVHALSGEILLYVQLARHLGADQPVYGVQDPWLDGVEPVFTPIEAMAERYVGEVREVQPVGPYHLGGYSFGGAVAFEMARQLRAAGEEVAFLGVLDTDAPVTRRRGGGSVSGGALGEMRVEVRDMWKLVHDKAVYHGRELPERGDVSGFTYEQHLEAALHHLKQLDLVDADAGPEAVLFPSLLRHMRERVMASYEPGTYDGPVTLFRADDRTPAHRGARTGRARPPALGWDRVCTRPVEILPVPGDHLTLTAEPHVSAIAVLWKRCLERASGAGGHPPAGASPPRDQRL